MNWRDYFERHRYFFDLDHIRSHADGGGSASEEPMLEEILDPRNANPLTPNILFDCAHYARLAGLRGSNPLLHYLNATDPVSPHPLFDPDFYRERLWQECQQITARPLEHFLEHGRALGIDPSPYFRTASVGAGAGDALSGLRGYLARTDPDASPHGLIDGVAFRRVFGDGVGDPASLLVTEPQSVPMDITPFFDSRFYGGLIENSDAPAWGLREHYFRAGFHRGLPPNGLISKNYILGQFPEKASEANTWRFYLDSGLHQRPRLLVAVEALSDEIEVSSWLDILEKLIRRRDLEVIVIAARGGPLLKRARQLAHVSILCGDKEDRPELATLDRRFRRTIGLLEGNMPEVAICVGPEGSDINQLASAYIGKCVSVPMASGRCNPNGARAAPAASPGFGVAKVNPDDFLCFDAEAARTERSSVDREHLLSELDLAPDTVLVLGSGSLTFDGGVDFFANLAAHALTRTDPSVTAHFLWFSDGTGRQMPPLVFARHRFLVAGLSSQFTHLDQSEFDRCLGAADLYLQTASRPGLSADIFRAMAAGVPVIAQESHPFLTACAQDRSIASIAECDLSGASATLVSLLKDRTAREGFAARARELLVSHYTPEGALARLGALLDGAGFPLKISDPCRAGEKG